MPAITVVGSINMDVIVRVRQLPSPGMTLLGHGGDMIIGGKGLNQSRAAAKAGASVSLIGRVGADSAGTAAHLALDAAGVCARHVVDDDSVGTGHCAIAVSDDGENMIVVAPGANAMIAVEQIERARDEIESADILVVQLEVPMPSVAAALRIAQAAGVPTLLNPAPANRAVLDLLPMIDVITPNETELSELVGTSVCAADDDGLRHAMEELIVGGVGTVVVTLGRAGCAAWDGKRYHRLEGIEVDAVDTTGAGDVFSGYLAAGLAEHLPLIEAMHRAQAAAALSVQRSSADAAPNAHEVEAFISAMSGAKRATFAS